MELLEDHDWGDSDIEDDFFFTEEDLDNCVINRIVTDTFLDPLISSDSEDDKPRTKINWAEFIPDAAPKDRHVFIPGLKHVASYLKLSALGPKEHYICLKVLCADYRHTLAGIFIGRPSRRDRELYEQLKPTYLKEQEEYINWAKAIWKKDHCARAFLPKPLVETLYEAEFKMRANKIKTCPKLYEVAAQISLESPNNTFKMTLKKVLKNVKSTDLPQIHYPNLANKAFSIMQSCPVPKPCEEHPCAFVLPFEKSPSILPFAVLNTELSEYALDHGAQYVASEGALRCLLESERGWTLPVSVCEIIGPDGDKSTITVLGSEFSANKDPVRVRTYKAFRHLLLHALLTASEDMEIESWETPVESNIAETELFSNADIGCSTDEDDELVIDQEIVMQETEDDDWLSDKETWEKYMNTINESVNKKRNIRENIDLKDTETLKCDPKEEKNNGTGSGSAFSANKQTLNHKLISKSKNGEKNLPLGPEFQNSSDEEDELVIDQVDTVDEVDEVDDVDEVDNDGLHNENKESQPEIETVEEHMNDIGESVNKIGNENEKIELKFTSTLDCSCKGTEFEMPPPRSFKKWQLENLDTKKVFNIIIHCSHKAQRDAKEVVLEPIPEFQLDLGASKLPEGKARCLQLAMLLRGSDSSVLKVRLDGRSGDVVTLETEYAEEETLEEASTSPSVAGVLHTVLNQLDGLKPGQYLLRHEMLHGPNVMLYVPRDTGQAQKLQLHLDYSKLPKIDETKDLVRPPTLEPSLLPMHKFRRILPCAFTPYEKQVLKQWKKPINKHWTPHPAITLDENGKKDKSKKVWAPHYNV